MSDSYRTVTALVKVVRPNAIAVERPRGPGNTWIPRSLIHGGDDLKIDGLCFGSEGIWHTFRLVEWKAEEAGLS
ncbi:MAG TPA: hypothetical protein VF226_02780 [Hyphomicrobiaceae bacterium]